MDINESYFDVSKIFSALSYTSSHTYSIIMSRVDTYHITQLHKFPPYKFLHFEDFEELFLQKKTYIYA